MKQSKHRITIRTMQVAIVILAAVYLFLAVWRFAIVSADRINNQYEIRLKETGDQLSENISRHILTSVSLLDAIGQGFGEYDDIHSKEAINNLISISPKTDFTRMWLTKEDGEAFSSDGLESDASGRDYLEDGLKGNSGISNVQNSRVNDEVNVVVYAPIYKGDNIPGLVIGIYSLEELSDVLDIECFNDSGYSYIFDSDGNILVRSNHEDEILKGENILDYWNDVHIESNLTVDDIKDKLSNNEASIIRYNDGSEERMGYFCPVGVNDWYTFVSFPSDIVVTERNNTLVSAGILCVKFIIVVALVLLIRGYFKNRKLKYLAEIDIMTGILNRGTAEKYMNNIIKEHKNSTYALVLFDIDKFKQINDEYGHIAGDNLLKNVATIVKEEFGEDGLVGRLGGDEFIILADCKDNRDLILKRARAMAKRVSKLSSLYNNLKLSISVGVAFSGVEGNDFNELYKLADERMYKIKKNGGNSVGM